jgi:hypothetical protein
MNVIPMTSKLLVPFAAAALLAGLHSTATAQKKPKVVKACGITAIPLAVGNKWVYQAVEHPAKLPPEQSRLLPVQPQSVTITVDAVETKDAVTTVNLTEVIAILVPDPKDAKKPPRLDEKKVQSTIQCTATTLSISPDSFWFSGEPGGFWNVEIEGLERKGQSIAIAGGKIDGVEWHDDVKARWKRVATPGSDADLGSGTFDLNRRVVFTADESVTALAGQYSATKKIGIETKGEIAVDDASGKPYVLPDGIVSFYWLANGVGIVQIHNSFVHAYQLKEVTLAT